MSEQDVFARLSALAAEKHRLTEEQRMWTGKLARIAQRLAETEQRMDRLRRQISELEKKQESTTPPETFRVVELPY